MWDLNLKRLLVVIYAASQDAFQPQTKKKKKKLPLRNFLYFLKKIYPKSFLYFGITSDLIYYHNSSIPLKNFCYFPEKSLANFPTPSPRKQKSILKKLLIFFPKIICIFWNKYWPSIKFLICPLYPKTTADKT